MESEYFRRKRLFERTGKDPLVPPTETKTQVDGDTVRVRLPGKASLITFEVQNINDDFLTSNRTFDDFRKFGLSLAAIDPTGRTLEKQAQKDTLGPKLEGENSNMTASEM
jgi:hypothetical protein